MSKKALSIAGNCVLFLSSLLLVVDIAPRDFFPSYLRHKKAISELRDKHNIYVTTPGINLRFQSGQGHADAQAYELLKELIIRNSPLVNNVDWDKSVGIGYVEKSIPVAGNKLIAFRALYVAQLPDKDDEEMMSLIPVGQLSDLDMWLKAQHIGSLTITATVLLSLGFLLQLIAGFIENNQKKSWVADKT